MRQSHHIRSLEVMAKSLGDLSQDVVVVGGSVVELLLTDEGSPLVRSTIDIDVIIEIKTRIEYYGLEGRLRSLGYAQRQHEPICRWFGHDIILDVLPDNAEILGFSNRWYASAFQFANSASLPSGAQIRVIDAPHFLATKLEAFHSRGESDIFSSHDFEDIVILLNGRSKLSEEITVAQTELRDYVSESIQNLLGQSSILEGIEAALAANKDALDRASLVLERMHRLLNL